ncbi:MAG: phenazine biosynthesis protein PhzF family [Steroidobacteraceae bacterium]|nr:phenazine biosynthesis protein PhzF family [Steroidobacteraceae bacterium]
MQVKFAPRMSRRIRIFQVDAFTTDRFTGNPAGVVLDADSLTDAEMLAIARELNNADTAFVLKPDGADHDLRVRFFTPRTEASFVGHATVATHFVLSREGVARLQGEGGRVRQKQKSGLVTVEVRGEGETRRIAVRQPAPPLGRQLNDRERLAVLDALALSTGDIDTRCPLRIVGGSGTRLLIGVRNTDHLKQLKPDFLRLTTLSAQLGAAGFFVFTLTHALPGCLTESRMFCPALGIPEDPVSGNAHGLLGAYLAEQGLLQHTNGSAKFTGAQGHHLHRSGRIDVELEFTPNEKNESKLDAVWIVGQAVSIFETEMTL